MDLDRRQPLLAGYAALLHVYPPTFRRQFGQQMLSDSAEILEHRGGIAACALVVRELPSTLLREHLDDPTAMTFLLRLLLCSIPPLAICTAALSRAARVEEFALITFWTLCILGALVKTRCRGPSCLVRTML